MVMDAWVIDLLKQSPAIGAILAIVWMGLKWHERMSSTWLAAIDKIDERGKLAAEAFVMAVKDIGEKCHKAHDENARMFYEQSCKGQEVLIQLSMTLANFTRAQDDLSHAVRDLRR